MKKWLIVLLVCSTLIILWLYVFIPTNILISGTTSVATTRDGLHRNLANENNWIKWWPGKYVNQSDTTSHKKFIYKNSTYSINEIRTSSFIISISKDKEYLSTSLQIFPDADNSLRLIWEGRVHNSLNPFNRIQMYLEAKQVNKDINELLQKMQVYLSKNENVYGIPIHKEHVVDSILIFRNAMSAGYPANTFIYGLINELKKHIAANSAHETGFPMLNIYTDDSINYQVKVAIPVDKRLPESGSISLKLMPAGGNILVTDVNGDQASVNRAFQQLKEYIDDHHYIAPAIPFLSLVTDRTREPDPTKWITRIYYPVMHY